MDPTPPGAGAANGGSGAGHVPEPSRRWQVGGVVFAAQLLASALLARRVGPLYEDGWDYHHLAVRLGEVGAFGPPSAGRPPGWVFLLAGWYRLTGPHPNAGLVLTALLAAGAAVAVVVLAERLELPARFAALAGLGYALFPWTLVMGASLYSETLFNLLLVLVALVADRAWTDPRPPARWSALGALTGLGALVRPVMLFWVPIAVLTAVFRHRSWKGVLLLVAGVVVVLTPWTVRNHARFGRVIPITSVGGKTLAVANNDVAGAAQADAGLPRDVPDGEIERDEAYRRYAVRWIREHPGTFAVRAVQRVGRTFDPVTRLNKGVVGPPPARWVVRGAWLALLVPVAVGIRRRHRGRWLVPLGLVASQVGQVVLFGGGFRFLFPALPFFAIWGVVGAEPLIGTRGLRARRRPTPTP